MKKLAITFVVVFFVCSCSSKFSIQKRKYTKGFYFGKTSNKKNEPSVNCDAKPNADYSEKKAEKNITTTVINAMNESNSLILKESKNKVKKLIAVHGIKDDLHSINFKSKYLSKQIHLYSKSKIYKHTQTKKSSVSKRIEIVKIILASICFFLGTLLLTSAFAFLILGGGGNPVFDPLTLFLIFLVFGIVLSYIGYTILNDK